MKTAIQKLYLFLCLIAALSFTAIPALSLQGCAGTPAQATAYRTIYSLEKGTTAAYDGYLHEVFIARTLPTNDVPKISRQYDLFQASMLVALDTVEFNTNAIAPPNLQTSARDLLNLIEQIRAQKKEKQ